MEAISPESAPNWLADTNIWLRLSEPAHPMFAPAFQAVGTILGRSEEIVLVPQVITEYWRVVTASASQRGGFGWEPAQADAEVRQLEAQFPMRQDTPDIYDHWREIVRAEGVTGASVYDARLVAVMLVHGLTRILTFNVKDFRRYERLGILPVHPSDL